MSHVLVGVFDVGADARRTRQALLDRGYPAHLIQLMPSRPPREHGDEASSSVERSRSVSETVGEMFRSLFVEFGGVSDDEQLYNEAVRRGSVVMSVQAPDSQHEAIIHEVMQQHGAMDIHELSERWRRSGWQGPDPNAPAMSAQEIEAERQQRLKAAGTPALGEAKASEQRPASVRVYRAGRSMERGQ